MKKISNIVLHIVFNPISHPIAAILFGIGKFVFNYHLFGFLFFLQVSFLIAFTAYFILIGSLFKNSNGNKNKCIIDIDLKWLYPVGFTLLCTGLYYSVKLLV